MSLVGAHLIVGGSRLCCSELHNLDGDDLNGDAVSTQNNLKSVGYVPDPMIVRS